MGSSPKHCTEAACPTRGLTVDLIDLSQALGLLAESAPITKANVLPKLEGPAEPLAYMGNPEPLGRDRCGSRPGLPR
jgi:hypothetical protein